MPEKKSSAASAAKKKVVKKVTSAGKKQAAKAVKNARRESKTPQKNKNTMIGRITPYVLVLLAVILAICFITVHVMELDDGVGIVGYYVQALFCATLGAGAFAFPAAIGYIGVLWCVFNVKWAKESKSSEPDADYIKAKRKARLKTAMSILLVISVSALISVISYQDFDLLELWSDGVECVGGGILGGSLGCLFILCFEQVISIVIICFMLLVFGLFACGITPDYIIASIRQRHQDNVERRLEEKRWLEEYEKNNAPEPPVAPLKSKQRPEIKEPPAPKAEDKTHGAFIVDELLDDNVTPVPLSPKVANKITPEPEVHIGPSLEDEPKKPPIPSADAPASNEAPLDFGGDPTFDKGEFSGIDDILKNLTPPPPSAATFSDPAQLLDDIDADGEATDEEESELDLTKMENDELLEDTAAVAPDEGAPEDEPEIITPYVFPPYDLLTENKDTVENDYSEELRANAKVLVDTLRSFKVGIRDVTYSRGPTITRYELKPEVGTRVRSIANLVDDIALNLATSGVRIEAPIPNKAAVGIEVPNKTRATVYLRDLIENNKFYEASSRLTASLGMDVGGNPIYFDIAKMPHLLIAGTTGSGKSICINCIIISILYKAKPEDVKLILIDPKKVEFNMYKNIPHLYCPIVSEPKKAAGALASAVMEMERRFELIESVGVRDIKSYNALTENDPEMEYMPQMVIIIDELADLMMTARDEVETSICRIAQKARAAGIHIILGTQRPSVDVITGLIKANVPSRIACTVTSQVDSRTIIDVAGAENLIGRGDMLFAPVGASKPVRVQGAFVSDSEVEKIVTYISENNGKARFNAEFMNNIELEAAKCGNGKKGASASNIEDMPEPEGGDTKFRDAVKLAIETGKISTSLMQRRLGVGYGRAAKIIDSMEQMGYVSAQDGNKPRQVLITMDEYMRRVMEGNLGGDE